MIGRKCGKRSRKQTRRQRGMALIFTLGVLAAILVMALIFASRARSESKVSSIHTDNQAARILAQSLVQHVIKVLDESEGMTDVMLYSSGYSINKTDSTADEESEKNKNVHYDWIWKLETGGYFKFTPSSESGSGYTPGSGGNPPTYKYKQMPTWQYIKEPGGVVGTNDNKKIIARYAFATVPVSSRLNPNAVANHVYCTHIHGPDNKINDSSNCPLCRGLDNNNYNKEQRFARPGVSAAELVFRKEYFPSTLTASGNADKLTYFAIRDKFYTSSMWQNGDPLHWTDEKDFISKVLTGISIPDADSTEDEITKYTNAKNALEEFFEITESEDREAFWSDDGSDTASGRSAGDGVQDVDEYYHRFNLRRTDWASLTIDSLLKKPEKFDTTDPAKINKDSNGKQKTSPENFDTGGISWLNNWGDDGDWGSSDDTKKQIAANLLNYCSPASRKVVSDVDSDDWPTSDTVPKYTGLKRTLYFNELFYQLKFSAEVSVEEKAGVPGTNVAKVTYNMDYSFLAELIDMYFDTLGQKLEGSTKYSATPNFNAYRPYLAGTVSFDCWNPKNSTWENIELNLKDLSFSRFEDLTGYSPGSNPMGYYGYAAESKVSSNEFSYDTTKSLDGVWSNDVQVKNLKVNIKRALAYRTKVTDGVGDRDDNNSFPSGSTREYVDYASLEIDKTWNNTYSLRNNSNGTDLTIVGDMEANDPRQNLRRSDWTTRTVNSERGNADASAAEKFQIEDGKIFYDTEANTMVTDIKNLHSLPFKKGRVSKIGTNTCCTVNYGRPNSGSPTRDVEVVDDPAWGHTTGKKTSGATVSGHVSTAFIRHAKPTKGSNGEPIERPMESPWELGAIHRGSAWKTLNIAVSPDYDTAKGFVDKGGGTFEQGDAPILDQVKMINDTTCLGKVNLCRFPYSGTDARNFTIGALFYKMPFRTTGNYIRQQLNTSTGLEDTSSAVNASGEQLIMYSADGSTSDYFDQNVETFVNTLYSAFLLRYNPDKTKNKFFRRTDLLTCDRVMSNGADLMNPLRGSTSNVTNAIDEQIAGRIMNLIKYDQASVRKVIVVLVVQTIRDSGYTIVARDWNSNGKLGETIQISSANETAQFLTGYRRFKDLTAIDSSSTAFAGNGFLLREKIDGYIGFYDNGADAITGEIKVVASLEFDSTTLKWKIARMEYAE